LAIYQYVQGNPSTNIESIRQHLGGFREFTTYQGGERYLAIEAPPNRGGLARRLGCLVKLRTLTRTPTVEQLRREAGYLLMSVPEGVFRYTVPVVTTPAGAERASTIATRLSALSALWSYLVRSGENIAGRTEPLLKFNIWREPLKLAQVQAPSHREVTRARKTPNLELYLRILATTFLRTHGRHDAFSAAQATFWGQPVPPPIKSVEPSFSDLRDRALLLLMAQTGVRSREIHRLKRSSLAAGQPPVLTIIGKRGKKRAIGLPPVAGAAMRELDDKIQLIAAHQLRYGRTDRAASLLTASAPLLPAVAYWGANAGQSEQGLTRPGIAQVLRRRAVKAGIEPGSAEFARAHPHGLRHLYAKIALETTPPHRVRAIMGHASLATTGRYAEERDPARLVAEAFRGPAVAAVAPLAPALAPERIVVGPEPEPEDVAVRAPTPRRSVPEPPPAPPPPAPPPPEPPPPEHEPAIVRRVVAERVEQPPTVAKPKAPTPAKRAALPPKPAAGFDAFVAQIVTYRKIAHDKPLTQKEVNDLALCAAMSDVSLRNLCIIYDIHWGESKNRQQLIPTGGGKESGRVRAKKKKERVVVEKFEPNIELEEEEGIEVFDPEEIDIEAELAAMEAEEDSPEEAVQRIERVERGLTLFSEAGTDKVARIYSGKDSGLNWWTGTNGKLKPAMPVMSPAQVGACDPATQDAVCSDLVALWRKWAVEKPTKAEALVAWIGEALDLSAQMEAIILSRGGKWVPSDTAWGDTRWLAKPGKTRKEPAPRLVFREHLPQAITAWFEQRGHDFRVSAGDPGTWLAKTARPKVIGAPPPDWFYDEDPIAALPIGERRELTDWLLALTGQLPVDSEPRYGLDAAVASRADVAAFVNALCQFDGSIDALREDRARYGPSYVAKLWKLKSVDEFPERIRQGFVALQQQARALVSEATLGKVDDFDAFDAIRQRVKKTEADLKKKSRIKKEQPATARFEQTEPTRVVVEDERSAAEAEIEAIAAEQAAEQTAQSSKRYLPNAGKREGSIMRLVSKFFGAAAAKDPAIKLVAKCGKVPLSKFRELFQIKGGTIAHDDAFKAAFARQHGTHSECVARRIARKLWETKKRSPRSEYVTKPQHMVMLVDIMETFKVPCTRSQEQDLAYVVKYADEPREIYGKWARLRTASTEQTLTEAEEIQREFAEEFSEQVGAEEIRAKFRENPSLSPMVPTPVHLTCALMV
jgi:integrase